MDLSVVIPAYNESSTLEKTIEHINNYFAQEHIEGEILVINDGSTDSTKKLLDHLQIKIPLLRVFHLPINEGKGFACRVGFNESRGEWCIIMDADESTRIEMWSSFKKFTDRYDILIGSRSIKGSKIIIYQNPLKILAGKLGNKWIQLVTGLRFYDTQCGFKAFHSRTKKLLKYAESNRWSFDIEWLSIATKLGFKIKELPVEWRNDPSSSVKPLDYIDVLIEIIMIQLRVRKMNVKT